MHLNSHALSAVLCLTAVIADGLPRCPAAPLTQKPAQSECFFQPGDTNEQIVKQIKLAVPALGDASLCEFDKICAVRHWLSGFIPGADASSGFDLTGRFGVDHFSATTANMLSWRERRQAGMQCGGASVLAYRVFRLLGYDALVINVGNAALGVTHVTTLVKLDDPAKPAWTVQDVSYDFTFLDADDKPLDYRQLLDLLGAGKHSEYHMQQPPDARFVALYPLATDPRQIKSLARRSPELLQVYDGYSAYSIRENFADTFEQILGLGDFLQAKFQDREPTMIFLLPFGCSGEQVALGIVQYAREVRKRRHAATNN